VAAVAAVTVHRRSPRQLRHSATCDQTRRGCVSAKPGGGEGCLGFPSASLRGGPLKPPLDVGGQPGRAIQTRSERSQRCHSPRRRWPKAAGSAAGATPAPCLAVRRPRHRHRETRALDRGASSTWPGVWAWFQRRPATRPGTVLWVATYPGFGFNSEEKPAGGPCNHPFCAPTR